MSGFWEFYEFHKATNGLNNATNWDRKKRTLIKLNMLIDDILEVEPGKRNTQTIKAEKA